MYDYNPNKRLLDKEEQAIVLEFLNNNADAKKVAHTMRNKTNKNVNVRDIHNVRTKANKMILNDLVLAEGDTCDKHMLEIRSKLDAQIKKDGSNYFKYALDEPTERISLIFYQTKHMQELYAKYGQVLFIDGTYKINKNDYSCYLVASSMLKSFSKNTFEAL